MNLFILCLVIDGTIAPPAKETESLRKTHNGKHVCPIEEASIFSQLIYSWFDEVMEVGYKRPLTVSIRAPFTFLKQVRQKTFGTYHIWIHVNIIQIGWHVHGKKRVNGKGTQSIKKF